MDEKALDLECPICYESLTDAPRSLSCGHAFCHDCLVRTFVGLSRERAIARDTIICPMCRHVTFVSKRRGLVGEKGQHAKILEVPVMWTARPVSRSSGEPQNRRICRCLKWLSPRLRCQRLVCPKESLQVFIISDVGRPIAEEDIADLGTDLVTDLVTVENSSDRRCTRCSLHCLVFLLVLFTLLALIAATLPWVLLA